MSMSTQKSTFELKKNCEEKKQLSLTLTHTEKKEVMFVITFISELSKLKDIVIFFSSNFSSERI